MSRYANNTEVTSDRSRAEIEATLRRYGASSFGYGWDQDKAIIAFRLGERQIRFMLPLPDKSEFRYTPSRRLPRNNGEIERAWEQACRQRWRALALVIKAKLEAVESGIVTAESEFLAYTCLPDGGTVGEWLSPQLNQVYLTGEMPSCLPGVGVALPALTAGDYE